LLLTHNDTDAPYKQFDSSRMRNKKLKNILQCATRQQFIRHSFSFSADQTNHNQCAGISSRFANTWDRTRDKLGGDYSTQGEWTPSSQTGDSGGILIEGNITKSNIYIFTNISENKKREEQLKYILKQLFFFIILL
jgi:hypothetical protein